MYKLIIFDVDGTLIDTENAVRESYQETIFEELGRHFTDEELSVAYGIPTPQAMERLGIKDIEKACSNYYSHLFRAFDKVRPFSGIEEVLAEIREKRLDSGIVTSRNRSEVANDKSLQNLLKYFSHVMCSEDTDKHKPEPEPIQKLLEKTGVDASEAIYLGDTYYDYMCAKNAGVKFALAGWGARTTDNIVADYVLYEPKELLALLAE